MRNKIRWKSRSTETTRNEVRGVAAESKWRRETVMRKAYKVNTRSIDT
jgi:hypothetical protein